MASSATPAGIAAGAGADEVAAARRYLLQAGLFRRGPVHAQRFATIFRCSSPMITCCATVPAGLALTEPLGIGVLRP